MVALRDQPGETVTDASLKYVNRLSDFLFVAGRYANDKGDARRALGADEPDQCTGPIAAICWTSNSVPTTGFSCCGRRR